MSNKANNNNNEKQVENFTTVWDSVRRAETVNGLQFKTIDKLLYIDLLGWQVSKDDPNNKKVTKVSGVVRELQQELDVSNGTIETSLKTLEKMGLIVIKRVGFSNEYDVRNFSDVESTEPNMYSISRDFNYTSTHIVGEQDDCPRFPNWSDIYEAERNHSMNMFVEYESMGLEPSTINSNRVPLSTIQPTMSDAELELLAMNFSSFEDKVYDWFMNGWFEQINKLDKYFTERLQIRVKLEEQVRLEELF